MARNMAGAAGGILSYFVRHRTAANLLLLVLLVAGVVSTPNMRAQFFPDIVVDDLTVSVTWQGAGAEDVDEAIVQVLEPVLLGVEGVTSSSATSREGRASMDVQSQGAQQNAAGDCFPAAHAQGCKVHLVFEP